MPSFASFFQLLQIERQPLCDNADRNQETGNFIAAGRIAFTVFRHPSHLHPEACCPHFPADRWG
jgi:hypothetical protein